MGNLGGPSERQFGPGCDSRPPDHFQILVSEDARRDATSAELLHIITSGPADERLVRLGVEPMAQAPAHRGIRVLGPEHRCNIVESFNRRGTHLDGHHATLNPGDTCPTGLRARVQYDHFLVPLGCGRGMPYHLHAASSGRSAAPRAPASSIAAVSRLGYGEPEMRKLMLAERVVRE